MGLKPTFYTLGNTTLNEDYKMTLDDFLGLPFNYPGMTLSSELMILRKHITNLRNLELSSNSFDEERLNKELKSIDLGEGNQCLIPDYEAHLISSYKYKIENITPRISYNPMVVALWGVLESSINNFCMFANIKEKPTYKFKETHGKDLVSKSRKYLNEYLEFNIDYSHSDKLIEIRNLRNYLAHSNGSINHLPKEILLKISKTIDKLPTVKLVENDCIVVSYEAMTEIFDIVNEFLESLQMGFAEKYNYTAYTVS